MNKTGIYIAFYKPYGCLSQFRGEPSDHTLARYDFPKNVYPVGRLDKDSEGLLILSNDGIFNQKLANPSSKKMKTYWVQVERAPSPEALKRLEKGVAIKDYVTRPCSAKTISPTVCEREPPIRYRKNVETAWLEIRISEGKNRQVRRMTAAIGHPTLRLIRVKVGKLALNDLAYGQWKYVSKDDIL